MHIYAFGSICRGEIDRGSDVDLLTCVDGPAPQIDRAKYSVYQYARLQELWKEGNPFAWHLYLESRLLFSSDGSDFLLSLGEPGRYSSWESDFAKFKNLFDRSYLELQLSPISAIFHLSCMFLAVRNLATCHSIFVGKPVFSRKSPMMIQPSLDIDLQGFTVLTRARLLSTRGYGENLTPDEIAATMKSVANVPQWMEALWNQETQ